MINFSNICHINVIPQKSIHTFVGEYRYFITIEIHRSKYFKLNEYIFLVDVSDYVERFWISQNILSHITLNCITPSKYITFKRRKIVFVNFVLRVLIDFLFIHFYDVFLKA